MVAVQVGQEDGIDVLGVDSGIFELHEKPASSPHGLRADAGIHENRTFGRTQYVRTDAPAQGLAVGESPGISVPVRFPLILHDPGEDLIQPEKCALHVREGGDFDPSYRDAIQDPTSRRKPCT
jgi:hypothetical protein